MRRRRKERRANYPGTDYRGQTMTSRLARKCFFKSTAVVVTVTTVTVCHYVGHLLSSNKIMSMDDSVSTESHDHTELSRTSQAYCTESGV